MDIEQIARDRLAELPGVDPKRAKRARLTRLSGLTNLVFKVEMGDAPLCLRIPGSGAETIVDRRVEAVNARAAAEAGVAPDILHFGTDGTMLTRFIDGAPLTPERLRESPGALLRAAAALRMLHDAAADFAGVFDAFRTMQDYAALLDEGDAPLPARHREILAEAEPARTALAALAPTLRPCHCDLTGGNLIDDGERVWLIDWEYSAMNDPAWDLAYFSIELGLDETADHAFLAAYLGRPPSETETARVAVTKTACELLAGFWALVQEREGNRATDFSAYAERAFGSAAGRMESPAFAAQLETLRQG